MLSKCESSFHSQDADASVGLSTVIVVSLKGSTTMSSPYSAAARRSYSPYSFVAVSSRDPTFALGAGSGGPVVDGTA